MSRGVAVLAKNVSSAPYAPPDRYSVDQASRGFEAFSLWSVQVTGAFTGLALQLEGSLDGYTWVPIDGPITAAGLYARLSSTGTGSNLTLLPLVYVRANISTLTSGSVSVYAIGVS